MALKNRITINVTDPHGNTGTDCHELCAYLVEKALGRDVEDPTENLDYYDQEMQDCGVKSIRKLQKVLVFFGERCYNTIRYK